MNCATHQHLELVEKLVRHVREEQKKDSLQLEIMLERINKLEKGFISLESKTDEILNYVKYNMRRPGN